MFRLLIGDENAAGDNDSGGLLLITSDSCEKLLLLLCRFTFPPLFNSVTDGMGSVIHCGRHGLLATFTILLWGTGESCFSVMGAILVRDLASILSAAKEGVGGGCELLVLCLSGEMGGDDTALKACVKLNPGLSPSLRGPQPPKPRAAKGL